MSWDWKYTAKDGLPKSDYECLVILFDTETNGYDVGYGTYDNSHWYFDFDNVGEGNKVFAYVKIEFPPEYPKGDTTS